MIIFFKKGRIFLLQAASLFLVLIFIAIPVSSCTRAEELKEDFLSLFSREEEADNAVLIVENFFGALIENDINRAFGYVYIYKDISNINAGEFGSPSGIENWTGQSPNEDGSTFETEADMDQESHASVDDSEVPDDSSADSGEITFETWPETEEFSEIEPEGAGTYTMEDFKNELVDVTPIIKVEINWVEVRNNVAVVGIDLMDSYDGEEKIYKDLAVSLVKDKNNQWKINFWN
jgi:hypothetical protein